MPKTILQRIKELQSDSSYDEINNEINPLVISLVTKLVDTKEWQEFISHFIDEGNNTEIKSAQLARLTLKDSLNNDPYIKQTCAYLFANCVCGGTTTDRLHENINNLLDIGIDYNE